LIVARPKEAEEAFCVIEAVIETGAIDIVVIDSVAALCPRQELQCDFGDKFEAEQARLLSQSLRRLIGVIARHDVCLLMLNQVRESASILFGNPEKTTGGRALKYYASLRIELRRSETIKDRDRAIGSRTKVKIVKNKLAAPFREVEVDLLFGTGFSLSGDLLDIGQARGIIEKQGSWLTYQGERLGQGREAARQRLDADYPLRTRLYNLLSLSAEPMPLLRVTAIRPTAVSA
jgi:recombination protein RecA